MITIKFISNLKTILRVKNSIAKINEKKNKLLELNIEGRLTYAEFEKRDNVCNEELAVKEKVLKQLHKT